MKTSILVLAAIAAFPLSAAAQPRASHPGASRRSVEPAPVELMCLERLSVNRTAGLASSLLGRDGMVLPEETTNCLVVSGEPALVARLRTVIEQLESRARARGVAIQPAPRAPAPPHRPMDRSSGPRSPAPQRPGAPARRPAPSR